MFSFEDFVLCILKILRWILLLCDKLRRRGRLGGLECVDLVALITSSSWPESPKEVAADHFLIVCVQILF